MHWQLCLYCSFGFPQLLANSHPGAQRAPGPCPVPASGRAKKSLKETIEVCNKSLLGKPSSLSLLPAQSVVVELTKSLMALRPLCKVSLPLSRIFKFLLLSFKFCHMVFFRHMNVWIHLPWWAPWERPG